MSPGSPPSGPALGLWIVGQEALAVDLALGSAPCSQHPTPVDARGRQGLFFFREEKGTPRRPGDS